MPSAASQKACICRPFLCGAVACHLLRRQTTSCDSASESTCSRRGSPTTARLHLAWAVGASRQTATCPSSRVGTPGRVNREASLHADAREGDAAWASCPDRLVVRLCSPSGGVGRRAATPIGSPARACPPLSQLSLGPSVEDQRVSESAESGGGEDGADDMPGHPRVLEVVTDAGQVGDPARITCVDEVVVERLVDRRAARGIGRPLSSWTRDWSVLAEWHQETPGPR
jgi:hypothetical protein